MEIPFGKYKGQTIQEIASSNKGVKYLDWLIDNDDLDLQIKHLKFFIELNRFKESQLQEDECDKLIKTQTEKMTDEIWDDISGRAGIGNELDQIDDETKEDILENWAEIIQKNLDQKG